LRLRGLVAVWATAVVVTAAGCGGASEHLAAPGTWQADETHGAGGPPGTAAGPESADAGVVRPLSHGIGAAPTTPPLAPPSVTATPETGAAPTHAAPATAAPEPPPPPPRYEGECIAEYDGDAASRSEVAAALTAAAERTYWPTSAPDIRVPEDLLRATAWQESGWQSNVIACDGGVGLLQVMPGTAAWMNTRFGQSYRIEVYTDNAYLGGTYYAWLIKFFGDNHFGGDYTVDPGDCASHLDPCLLNAIIAAYNFGHGAVDTPDGIAIPNPRYVENVRALMTICECLSY
jgi:soluble lytic murein transglycosylase-like protein